MQLNEKKKSYEHRTESKSNNSESDENLYYDSMPEEVKERVRDKGTRVNIFPLVRTRFSRGNS